MTKYRRKSWDFVYIMVRSHLWHFIKPKTAIAPVFIRGVAVFVFALICTIFEIVAIFLLRFFDDCPHICLRDRIHNPFGNRRLCAGHLLVSCVCRKECSRCLWTAELYSFPGVPSKFRCKWILLQASFPAGGTPEGWCNRSESVLLCCLPVLQNRSCFEFCFYDPEVFFDLPAASVNYIYLDELFNEKAV